MVKPEQSGFPKLCISANGEVAKTPSILTDIILVRYPGPDFESSDGSDFRETAIRDNAPLNANAYLEKGRLAEQAVMCGDSRSAVIYFHIDDEQAGRVPQPKKEYRYRPDASEIPDGEAD